MVNKVLISSSSWIDMSKIVEERKEIAEEKGQPRPSYTASPSPAFQDEEKEQVEYER
jgi:hypothetical protein